MPIKYRVVEVRRARDVVFVAQRKWLFWWRDVYPVQSAQAAAIELARQDRQERQHKDTVIVRWPSR